MPPRILLVEDDADFATSLELALNLVGIDAVIAGSAEMAIEIMSDDAAPINVGFFDIKLPKEDGISCFEKIRSAKPGFTGIVMTGFRDGDLLARARSAGVVEVLLKPFKMAQFMELAKQHSEENR